MESQKRINPLTMAIQNRYPLTMNIPNSIMDIYNSIMNMADLEVGGMPELDVCGNPATMGTWWKNG